MLDVGVENILEKYGIILRVENITNILILDCRTLTEEQEIKLLLKIHDHMLTETPADIMLPIGIVKDGKVDKVITT